MQAYISISYNKRHLLTEEINKIKESLNQFNINSSVFVDNYKFDSKQENTMMKHAFEDIEKSDLLVAETSDKAIGIGIEVGYAKAKNIPVIYLRNIAAEHSNTVSGASDYQIIYKDTNDLIQKLINVLNKIINHNCLQNSNGLL